MNEVDRGSAGPKTRLAEDVLRAIIGIVVAFPAIFVVRFLTVRNGSESEAAWSWSGELLTLLLLLFWLLGCVAFARGGEDRPSAVISAGVVAAICVGGWLNVLFLALNHPR